MKTKTIQLVLKTKFRRLLESIENEQIRDLVAKNSIITGGCIASMLLNEQVHDFDIYFKTKEVAYKVACYYCKLFASNPSRRSKRLDDKIYVQDLPDRVKIIVQSAGVAAEESKGYKYFETTNPETGETLEYVEQVFDIAKDAAETRPTYRPVFLSSHAITLTGKVQLVTRFFGTPSEIHANYDFCHCMNYWTSWDNNLVLHAPALESLLTKDLRYVGSLYPLASIIRARKFIKRGWSISAGQYLKMVMQLNDLDLKDLHVLEEQLTGVDVAYFHEILDALREKDEKRVDGAYLVELIDRLF
jgi:hypothetical protein